MISMKLGSFLPILSINKYNEEERIDLGEHFSGPFSPNLPISEAPFSTILILVHDFWCFFLYPVLVMVSLSMSLVYILLAPTFSESRSSLGGWILNSACWLAHPNRGPTMSRLLLAVHQSLES